MGIASPCERNLYDWVVFQVPQYILDHMWAQKKPCRIICTQPRRISATSGLSYLAPLLLEDHGISWSCCAELVSDVL
jgi:hypothetical protein